MNHHNKHKAFTMRKRGTTTTLTLAAFMCCIYIYYQHSGTTTTQLTSFQRQIQYCRPTIPTILLSVLTSPAPASDDRTYWIPITDDPLPLLPDLRFKQPSPPTRNSRKISNKNKVKLAGPESGEGEEANANLCPVYRVPASPRPIVPKSWTSNKIMFGMSTTPDRVLNNLDVWTHWLPLAPDPLDPVAQPDVVKTLPLVLILTPPPNPTEGMRIREAVDEGQALGMHIQIKEIPSDRFETRYFSLVQEMWTEAERRKKEEGVTTDWFVFSDDDTFYPDFTSLIRLLSSYDPSQPQLVGALSESTKQVQQWGHIAYGGAGIYVSRALMEKMNTGDTWSNCLAQFGSAFGGDAMISHCAALVTSSTIPELLKVEDSLHQLDIRGDSTGWFQSGFLITSLHHWGSWFTLFPPWIKSGEGDQTRGVKLVGRAAKSVGGDNWGRRYVFGDGNIVVVIGYSVTVYQVPMTKGTMAQSEHTWFEFDTFKPMRPALGESVEKRTYYLTGVTQLQAGVVRLEHTNRENERMDIIWDTLA